MSNPLLLVAILSLLVAEPFLSQRVAGRVALDLIVSVILISAVWTVSRHRGLLVTGLLLAMPVFLVRWAQHVVNVHWLDVVWPVFAIAFFAFTAVVLLRQVLRDTTVTADTIAGAICVYLLLSVIWALTFSLVEAAHPGSFHTDGHSVDTQLHHFLYLSLITLSTVGYGDIVPATPPARMFAALEGVVGQLYLAVLVARLIALYVPPRSPHNP
jgi:hypothetical protein